jgi:thioredoxin 1
MATENVQTFTEGNFDDSVLKSGAPVLVDFWAEWCGPCKRLSPTMDALATEYAGKVTIGKLNVDENPNIPVKYQVRGIPTLLLFKGGEVVESVVGLAPKDDLKKVLDKHLSKEVVSKEVVSKEVVSKEVAPDPLINHG